MRHSAARHRYTYAEYLALEEASNVKHEYLDGEIFARAGGSPEHAELSVAISSALLTQLRGRCRVFSSDLRVRVTATGLATYPDVTVVCGALERDPDGPTSVVNPTLVVEVLSDSTEDYDRGEKLAHYQRIASLRAIVYAASTIPRIEVWRRTGDSWEHAAVEAGERLPLLDGAAQLDVDDLYESAA